MQDVLKNVYVIPTMNSSLVFRTKVEENYRYETTYRLKKICVECVTSHVTTSTSDDVTVMTSQWNISRMLRMSKMSNTLRHT